MRESSSDTILLTGEEALDTICVERTGLFGDSTHHKRTQNSKQRAGHVRIQPGILADRIGKCALVVAAEERREEP